jgi:release factor glutamine methyltransferase
MTIREALAEVLSVSRSSLIAAGPDPLAETSLAAFSNFINRRLAGECVAYIVGRKEFYGLEFLVNPAVLVPRPDTELLVQISKEQLAMSNERPIRVIDLCTGSGAIGIALKHAMPALEVWATDISAEALETAKTNAARLLPPSSSINFCQGDMYDAFPPLPTAHCSLLIEPFSLIISNPPYIPSEEIPSLPPEVRREPMLALDGGSDGLDLIRKIIAHAPEFLCPGGTLLLEADPRQMDAIAALLEQAGFADIQRHKDLSGRERVIQVRMPGTFYA